MSEVNVNAPGMTSITVINKSSVPIQVRPAGSAARILVVNKSTPNVNVGVPFVENDPNSGVRISITNNLLPAIKVQMPAVSGPIIRVQVRGIQGVSGIGAEEANAIVASVLTALDVVEDNLQDHIEDTNNPHEVTAEQVGADPEGSADAAQAFAIQRANHTGTQAQSTVDGLEDALAEIPIISAEIDAIEEVLELKADLVDGVIPTSQIPAIALVEYLGPSANQAAMLTLTGQPGDWTNRLDTGTMFILTGSDPTDLADWTSIAYPASPVTSVNGQTGVVVLSKTDVGLGNVDNTSDVNKPVSTAQAAADAAVLSAAAADATAKANAKVQDTIVNGETAKAPSQNAVYDALALKASVLQVQWGTLVFATASGTADAITAAITLASGLHDGMEIRFRATGANTITNPTLDINGLGAYTIYKFGGQALAAGDIFGSAHEVRVAYVASGPHWELINPAASGGGTPYTDADARAAVVINSIASGDTDHAPSRDAVYAAIALINTALAAKADTTYVDSAVIGLLDLKGDTNASTNPNYPVALKGDSYYITVAGKIGGASGKSVDVGDVYVAKADNAGGTEASVGTSWFVLEHNLTGALLSANNLSDIANVVTARSNLGLAAAKTGIIEVTFDAGSVGSLEAGSQADVYVPYGFTITQAVMLANVAGSAVIDVWQIAYASFPPADAQSITGGSPPTLSSAIKSSDSVLTGWTTVISAGATLRFNLDSASTCKRVKLQLIVTKD